MGFFLPHFDGKLSLGKQPIEQLCCINYQLALHADRYETFVKTLSLLIARSTSEVMVACLIVIIRVVTKLAILVAIFVIVRLFILWLQSAFCVVLALRAETRLCLAHFIELRVVVIVRIILEDLILLVLEVLVLKFLDDLLLLGTTLAILQIVHVKFVL